MILLLLDFDGTLAPIKPHPAQACLSPRSRSLVGKLAASPGIKTAIISGRSLADIKRLVPGPGLYYAGCHGLEMEGPGIKFIHPQARAALPDLKTLKNEMLSLEKEFPGAVVEDKRLSVALHYRRVAGKYLPLLRQRAINIGNKHPALYCQMGRKVYDFIPRVGWNKGQAVKRLVKKLSRYRPFPIYMGDDETDESAFRELSGRGLTILVESSEKDARKTRAVLRLRSIKGARAFLNGLVQ
jgi:alpha,alpha-trehalase